MPAAAPQTISLDVALQQAVAHHQAGRLQEAEQLYRAILQAQPAHPDANHNLGVIAVQMQQAAGGLPHFKAALEANPKHGQYWLSYIDALIQAGQTDVARQVLAQGRQLELSGDAVEVLAGRLGMRATPQISKKKSKSKTAKPSVKPITQQGNSPSPQEINTLVALFAEGRHAEAATLAQAMTVRFPLHGFGWKALGAVFSQIGRIADALVPLQKAAALSPSDAEAHSNLGNTLKKLGRLAEAETSYQQALRIKPDMAEAHYNLGLTLMELKRLTEAEACYRQALQVRPGMFEAHNNLGLTLMELKRLTEAEASYRRALQLKPDLEHAHNNLGLILKELGRLNEAEASYRQALQINPDMAAAYSNLGNTLRELGRLDEAEASYRRALQLKPDMPEALYNQGLILKDMGRLDEAESSYRWALQLKPDYAEVHNNLGNTLKALGRLDEAEASYRQALQIKSDYAEAHNNLGLFLFEMGRLEEAEASCRRALQLKPDMPEAHSNLGNTLKEMGRLDDADASYRRALQLKPDYAEAHNNLGLTLQDMGRMTEAEACCRQALQIEFDFATAHSNLLFLLNYTSGNTPTSCLEEARRFGRMIVDKAKLPFTEWSCPKQPERLRIGLVSGDFRNHPVGYFLEGLLTRLNPNSVELIAYPTALKIDDLTARIKPRFAAWKSLLGLSDEAAAHLIHGDGIHVLVDLSGHTQHNRLPMFTWKPAPVQVSWLGYFATTGVEAIDYLIADPWTLPKTEEAWFTEKIWRLPETRLCFTAPNVDVEVSALPALANGYITFGCFNNPSKMNDDVVALWVKVLGSVPESRLFLKSKQFINDQMRQNTIERFAAHGIEAERLVLEYAEPRDKYLAAYHRVDIALDPFPYPGGTTSVEGLWMGVPVLTLAGERFLSRQGVGILMNAGLPEWIAADADDYVARAVSHATDLQRLSNLRSGLRHQVLASPLFDAPRFTRNFEAALRGMWQQWRDGQTKT